MARFAQISAAEERQRLRRLFAGARFALITTTIAPHERNDRLGRECPCCGHTEAWGLGRFDDLALLIDVVEGTRRNRWQQRSGDGSLAEFDEIAAMAKPWATPGAFVWHAPITFRCGEEQVDALCDDVSETILFSGGWRSGKTYLADSWWCRGWAKYGGRGEKFTLLAPSLKQAYNNMRKIFFGKETDRPLLPTFDGKPILAHDLPAKHTAQHMAFAMLDRSVVEMHHIGTGEGGNIEGDDWRRVMIDEAARIKTPAAYQVCRGRVTQSGGQIGLATVPDDDGAWIYDEIVQEWEDHRQDPDYHLRRVVTCSSLDNVFVNYANQKRLEAGTKDPHVRTQKIYGIWNRKDLFAYSDCWEEDEHARDIESHEPAAWGFTHDITSQVCRPFWGLPADERVPYCGGVDANWRPHTRLLSRVFGNPNDPETWTLVFLGEDVMNGDAETAALELAGAEGGRYQGAALCCDGSMFHDSHAHGGRLHKTNDARHYRREGFHVRPPILSGGAESNPNVTESRKLVRMMMRPGRILVSAVNCPGLVAAIPKVPNREKRKSDSSTRLDRTVYNYDDCMRYIIWRLFSKRMLPRRQGLRIYGSTPTARPT